MLTSVFNVCLYILQVNALSNFFSATGISPQSYKHHASERHPTPQRPHVHLHRRHRRRMGAPDGWDAPRYGPHTTPRPRTLAHLWHGSRRTDPAHAGRHAAVPQRGRRRSQRPLHGGPPAAGGRHERLHQDQGGDGAASGRQAQPSSSRQETLGAHNKPQSHRLQPRDTPACCSQGWRHRSLPGESPFLTCISVLGRIQCVREGMLFVDWFGMCAPLTWHLARTLPRGWRRCSMGAGLILNLMTGGNNTL